MKKLGKNVNRILLFNLIFILLIILFACSMQQDYYNMKVHTKEYHAISLDMIDQRLTSLIFEMNIFPGGAGGDILFLSKLSHIKSVVGITDTNLQNKLNILSEDFLEFLKGNSAYYKLRYINEEGKEIVRVDFDGESYKVIPESELQDKSKRYYFNEAKSLSSGEIYISPLDLNVENGKIENRGTEKTPVYVPVIRFATPIFDKEGNNKGIVIANVYADYFLDDVRRAQRDGESVFLINEEGYYLAHPNKSKEFAFMLEDRDYNFYNDYPNVADEILSNFDKGRVGDGDSIFSYRYLYPTIGSFEVHRGSEKVLGENHKDKYYWILVSISDNSFIEENLTDLEKSFFFYTTFSGIIVLLIFILTYFLSFKIYPRNKKR